jgi:uncharacterized protein YdhG (YjbR/CyaY superfamily)
MSKSATTVDKFLMLQNSVTGKTLSKMRRAIKAAAPKAEEKIAYGIPYYRYNGPLAAFMSHKNHCSLVTMSYGIIKKMKNDLKPYKVSGTTIHFPHDKALPSSLVKKIIKARLRENIEKQQKKSVKLR